MKSKPTTATILRSDSDGQLYLATILEMSDRERERAIDLYIATHRETYIRAAVAEQPEPYEHLQVLLRFTFAILSANTSFESAVGALKYCADVGFKPAPSELGNYQCVPEKARYIYELSDLPSATLLRLRRENWTEYRERIATSIAGLGRAKASFAIGLCYPLHADVACIDTWLCKVAFPYTKGRLTKFAWLRKDDYEAAEGWVRRFAIDHKISTFLAQWMVWDFARGGKINTHDIFYDILQELHA